jgi:hypothetical protein
VILTFSFAGFPLNPLVSSSSLSYSSLAFCSSSMDKLYSILLMVNGLPFSSVVGMSCFLSCSNALFLSSSPRSVSRPLNKRLDPASSCLSLSISASFDCMVDFIVPLLKFKVSSLILMNQWLKSAS